MVCILALIYFDNPWLGYAIKQCKAVDCWFRDMFNFDFLEKGLEVVSQPHFVYDFSRKMFFKLCSINVWLPPLLLKDIGQYVYCNYLFPSLQCHKLWN